jgi:hypothetical protein
MSHGRHEAYEHTAHWHYIASVPHAVRGPPSRPHHCQSIQEHYIVRITPQLTTCMFGVPFRFVPEVNLCLLDASSNA